MAMSKRACGRCGRPTWSSRSPCCRDHRPPPEVAGALGDEDPRGPRLRRRAPDAARQHRPSGGRRPSGVRKVRPPRSVLGSRVDLDHGPDRSSYLGASHARCNRVQGARNGAAGAEPCPALAQAREVQPVAGLVTDICGDPKPLRPKMLCFPALRRLYRQEPFVFCSGNQSGCSRNRRTKGATS